MQFRRAASKSPDHAIPKIANPVDFEQKASLSSLVVAALIIWSAGIAVLFLFYRLAWYLLIDKAAI